MDNYLTGRGGSDNIEISKEDSSFRPFLSQPNTGNIEPTVSETDLEAEGHSEIIFDEQDCPKVEVISVESQPRQIVIHMPDGRLLKINCEYPES